MEHCVLYIYIFIRKHIYNSYLTAMQTIHCFLKMPIRRAGNHGAGVRTTKPPSCEKVLYIYIYQQ